LAHVSSVEQRSSRLSVPQAVAQLTERGVPAAVRQLGELYGDVQANATDWYRRSSKRAARSPCGAGAPGLDEHRGELLREAPEAE
jgi:hypothetical protein